MKSLVYILLFPFYLLFLLIAQIRNIFYDIGIFRTNKLDCIVISVGNISMGGTGKTPIVLALAEMLKKTHKIAILSRGYKRDSQGTLLVTNGNYVPDNWSGVGDEPFLMSRRLSGVPIIVDENRSRGGQYIVNRFNSDIILLDDAFQHRKLHRDIDIVLIDASRKRHLQLYREPTSSLKRASLILFTKTKDSDLLSYWRKQAARFNIPSYNVSREAGTRLIGLSDKQLDVAQVRNKTVIAFSGIANHQSFINTIEQFGCNIIDSLSFEDHHRYSAKDIKTIRLKFSALRPDYILTTEKDMLKLPITAMPIFAVPIQINISGEITNQIEDFLSAKK